jgi:LPXTG-motif cell wall-anchored protein
VTPTSALSFTTRTDKDGHYTFTHLPFGQYVVSAATAIKGFDYTSDTDGGIDWTVSVGVRAPETPAIADFAGLGKGEIVGQMFEESTGRGLALASIRCGWGGYDDVLGTADDVRFELTADSEGQFDMAGVPYGNFACEGVDAAGRRSASVKAAVFSAEPVRAPLPVGKGATLPNTGADIMDSLMLGLLAIGFGGVLVIGTRRRSGT